ncbi:MULTISPECIES: hypothetical protein [Sediminimonas]|uniref:Uncharacterized protein n=2 Tax=Sediminimonas qiaohouensis TaxID=552061 RepID=A0A7C9LPU5_9RHOB|nr:MULTISPECIES: hypothetical protein [Sediminimonas]MDR9486014.1 hypothetical protein [Sediminimonas sp.]MTJ03076.1 hypothetical protein [Sediminimonas qiaohouensis]
MLNDHIKHDTEANEIRDFVLRERSKAVSPREWKHRLAGYGYKLKETDAGVCVTSMLGGEELCHLPTAA